MLLSLWRSDEDSTGFEVWQLAYAICEELRPANIAVLIGNLWPEGKPDDERLELAQGAFKWWDAKRKRERSVPDRAA